MKNNSNELLSQLEVITQKCIEEAQKFQLLTLEQLNYKADEKSWSILECLEHLNLYGDFYIDEIGKQMKASKYQVPAENCKSSLLGSHFTKVMKVNDDKIKTMKTFVNMDPKDSQLPKSIVQRFIDQQQEYLKLLDKAKGVNIQKTKTSITISKLIKLRLCDTLMVVVYHNERHIWQANRVRY
jgi:hypothetical protein